MPSPNAQSNATSGSATTLAVVNPYEYLNNTTREKMYDMLAIAILFALIGVLLINAAAAGRAFAALFHRTARPFTERSHKTK